MRPYRIIYRARNGDRREVFIKGHDKHDALDYLEQEMHHRGYVYDRDYRVESIHAVSHAPREPNAEEIISEAGDDFKYLFLKNKPAFFMAVGIIVVLIIAILYGIEQNPDLEINRNDLLQSQCDKQCIDYCAEQSTAFNYSNVDKEADSCMCYCAEVEQ